MSEMSCYTLQQVQDAVRRFQVKVLPADITPVRQMGKLLEEAGEYLKDVGDRQKRVDAIADMFYVLVGVANLEHVDLEHVFNKVHASNMTKTADGSLSPKGEAYKPPEDLLPGWTVPPTKIYCLKCHQAFDGQVKLCEC